jgi:cobyrinic acid a,c-diamide synthase
MSVPRVLLAPTHRTGLAACLAAALVEIAGRQGRAPRFHQLGVVPPAAAWDRWEGSCFLDPALYPESTLVDLYERTVRGAQLSVIASLRGLLDRVEPGEWSPLEVAGLLDSPVVLLLDCRGWSDGITALVDGFAERVESANLAGFVLTGVRDRDHRAVLLRALDGGHAPVVGCLYEGTGLGWESSAPGAWGVPLDDAVLEAVHRQVDGAALESVASQRGFTPGALGGHMREGSGPLIVVAAGRGFTPWARDCVEVLISAGARVQRLDLLSDSELPGETAGLVVAGHVWPDVLPDLAENHMLMRSVRATVADGLPTLALGDGLLYLLRRVQDLAGRTVEMAGVIPADGEVLGELDEPMYVRVEAQTDTVCLGAGEEVTGWVVADTELVEPPVVASFPLSVAAPGWGGRRREGVASSSLLASRVLFHLASTPQAGRRFVEACAAYERSLTSSR